MKRLPLIALVALAIGACAPQAPEQRAALQQQVDAEQQCSRIATAVSGVPAHDAAGFAVMSIVPSESAALARFRATYQDCMAQRGFPGQITTPPGT